MESKSKKGMPAIAIIGIIIGATLLACLLVLLIAGYNFEDDSENDDSNTTQSETTEKTTTAKQTLAEKYSINVKNQGYDSAKFGYYISGTLTNNSSKKYSYIEIDFSCYNKDGNKVDTAMDNDSDLQSGETWEFKALAIGDGITNCELVDVDVTTW